MAVFEWSSVMPVPADELYAWHVRRGAFERLQPPWQQVSVVDRQGDIEHGGKLTLAVSFGPLRRRWVTVHRDAVPGRQFVDVQLAGPFARWEHTHRCVPLDEHCSRLEDHVEYELPGGTAIDRLAAVPARHMLERLFRFRHERTRVDLARHAAHAGRPPLRIVVSGASGLIGTQLTAFLTSGGHQVIRLVRRAPRGGDEAFWDLERAVLAADLFDGVDAVVHLAGESIASGRWNPARRRTILESRIDGTSLMARTLAELVSPPRVLISASAIGYYGSRGGELLTEESAAGEGFLAEVCKAWEAALAPARAAGIRTVPVRTGIALSAGGGALGKMLPAFRAGAGGPIGDGTQWMSWVALEDYLGAILHLLCDDSVDGPANLVAPQAVTNRDFARTLGRVLRRPAFVPLPAAAVHAAFGEMGDHLLLDSAHVAPATLQRSGFEFLYGELEPALRVELGLLKAVV